MNNNKPQSNNNDNISEDELFSRRLENIAPNKYHKPDKLDMARPLREQSGLSPYNDTSALTDDDLYLSLGIIPSSSAARNTASIDPSLVQGHPADSSSIRAFMSSLSVEDSITPEEARAEELQLIQAIRSMKASGNASSNTSIGTALDHTVPDSAQWPQVPGAHNNASTAGAHNNASTALPPTYTESHTTNNHHHQHNHKHINHQHQHHPPQPKNLTPQEAYVRYQTHEKKRQEQFYKSNELLPLYETSDDTDNSSGDDYNSDNDDDHDDYDRPPREHRHHHNNNNNNNNNPNQYNDKDNILPVFVSESERKEGERLYQRAVEQTGAGSMNNDQLLHDKIKGNSYYPDNDDSNNPISSLISNIYQQVALDNMSDKLAQERQHNEKIKMDKETEIAMERIEREEKQRLERKRIEQLRRDGLERQQAFARQQAAGQGHTTPQHIQHHAPPPPPSYDSLYTHNTSQPPPPTTTTNNKQHTSSKMSKFDQIRQTRQHQQYHHHPVPFTSTTTTTTTSTASASSRSSPQINSNINELDDILDDLV